MTFVGHTYAGLGFPFNIDGTRMLSSGFDTKAYVWGFTNGTALTEYTEQTNLTTGNAGYMVVNRLLLGPQMGRFAFGTLKPVKPSR